MDRIFRRLGVALAAVWALGAFTAATGPVATEAPTGFDGLTNGFLDQATFDLHRGTFEEREGILDGLGPVYNAQACVECHQSPVTGAGSQVVELRAGHFNGFAFVDAPGGSLINDRAIDASIQEGVPPGSEVRTFRTSLNTLGDGFVEAIDDQTFTDLRGAQPPGMRGQIIEVPVLEMPGATRIGRFGWKNQQASLLSFSSDAYLNEMGITNQFNTVENTSMGRSVAPFDTVGDPEDEDGDIFAFADFMRATKAPPRGPITANAAAGSAVFNAVGCNVCHTPSITTAHTGTVINGGAFAVPAALGDKVFHPFGDFMLHNVGTGDGIVQNGPPGTRNKLRTAPLWGLRTRSRLMHDGLSLTRTDAILRHGGEASLVTLRFIRLSAADRALLLAFLDSL